MTTIMRVEAAGLRSQISMAQTGSAVEALTPFVAPAVLAMMVGVRPATLATLVRIYIAIRLIHVAVYLHGGNAAKGGSIRTILYVSGALVTIISLP
jgi:uncharacterized MAPEG superfamily protein